MDAVGVIEAALAAGLTGEDGDPAMLELAPPATDAEVAALEAELGLPLPGELRDLLRRTRAIGGAPVELDFTGASMAFGGEDLFPAGVPVAADGSGNFWVADVRPGAALAPVFFACHDPPVLVVESDSLAGFLEQVVALMTPPHASRLRDPSAFAPVALLARENAAAAADPVLAAFAASLGEGAAIADLRGAAPGAGFEWGAHGPATEVRRHGHEPLFAVTAPPPRRRRWFGRGR